MTVFPVRAIPMAARVGQQEEIWHVAQTHRPQMVQPQSVVRRPQQAMARSQLVCGSATAEDNTVSFGNAGTNNQRRLTNVAAGTGEFDAVNVGQLNVVANAAAALDDAVFGVGAVNGAGGVGGVFGTGGINEQLNATGGVIDDLAALDDQLNATGGIVEDLVALDDQLNATGGIVEDLVALDDQLNATGGIVEDLVALDDQLNAAGGLNETVVTLDEQVNGVAGVGGVFGDDGLEDRIIDVEAAINAPGGILGRLGAVEMLTVFKTVR